MHSYTPPFSAVWLLVICVFTYWKCAPVPFVRFPSQCLYLLPQQTVAKIVMARALRWQRRAHAVLVVLVAATFLVSPPMAAVAQQEEAESPTASIPLPPEPILSVGFTLNRGEESEDAAVEVFPGQDTAEAIWNFCLVHNMGSKSLVEMKKTVDDRARHAGVESIVLRPGSGSKLAPQEYVSASEKLKKNGKFNESAIHLLRAFHPDDEHPSAEDGTLYSHLDELRQGASNHRDLLVAIDEGNYEAALEHGRRVTSLAPKAVHIFRTMADVLTKEGKWSKVLTKTSQCVQAAGTRGVWEEHHERSKCVVMAARAALELGDVNSANKRLSIILRAAPETTFIKPMYNKIKKIKKQMKKVDYDLKKGYNHRAVEALESILTVVEEFKLNSTILRGKFQLQVCKGLARIKKFEEALVVCDEAIEQVGGVSQMEGLFLNPKEMANAYRARAESYMADHDYREAVRDFRQVVEYSSGDEKYEAEESLRNAEWKEKDWEEHRDHQKVLGLPVNFDTLKHESKCAWLKKMHKKMVKKWHPDKRRKGNKKRAERKFAEVAEAKKVLEEQFECKRRGRKRRRL